MSYTTCIPTIVSLVLALAGSRAQNRRNRVEIVKIEPFWKEPLGIDPCSRLRRSRQALREEHTKNTSRTWRNITWTFLDKKKSDPEKFDLVFFPFFHVRDRGLDRGARQDGFVFEKNLLSTFLRTTPSTVPSKNHLVSPSRIFIMDVVRDTLCLAPPKNPIFQKNSLFQTCWDPKKKRIHRRDMLWPSCRQNEYPSSLGWLKTGKHSVFLK